MKDLIIQNGNDAILELQKITPGYHTILKEIEIGDTNPADIISFMKKNNIPENAWFGVTESMCPKIVICWHIEVKTNDKETFEFVKKRFIDWFFKRMYKSLTNNGYSRVSVSSEKLFTYNTSLFYDLFIQKEYDTIIEYFNLYFKNNN